MRLSVLALAAPRLQLEEEHEASQNFIVNDTSGQTRPQGARLLLQGGSGLSQDWLALALYHGLEGGTGQEGSESSAMGLSCL